MPDAAFLLGLLCKMFLQLPFGKSCTTFVQIKFAHYVPQLMNIDELLTTICPGCRKQDAPAKSELAKLTARQSTDKAVASSSNAIVAPSSSSAASARYLDKFSCSPTCVQVADCQSPAQSISMYSMLSCSWSPFCTYSATAEINCIRAPHLCFCSTV